MPKKVGEVAAVEVRRMASRTGFHAVGGVPGLHLRVDGEGRSAYWVLRVMVAGKRRDMGLGGFPEVSLERARRTASDMRGVIRQGRDPIAEREAARSAALAERLSAITFDEAAARLIESKREAWKNPKHAQQWENTLATYASPIIGALRVQDVGLPHVLAVLRPIWTTKTETASRLRARLEVVLDWARVHGHRPAGTPNPAAWDGNLALVLPAPGSVAEKGHHAAMPWRDMAPFMARLAEAEGVGALALRFAILTAARSGEVRGATWKEVDLEAGTWTVPGARMKAGREHRVVLSGEVLALLLALRTGTPPTADTLLFPGRGGAPLSDMTMGAVLKRMGTNCTVHGFRSAFRDWAAEVTSYPGDLVEMALAHAIGNKVEAAYRRGDMLDKRRGLMEDWAAWCAGRAPVAAGGVVVPIRSAA